MLSLQWTILSFILALEILFAIALLLPFINARVWHQFFNSKMVQELVHWRYFKPSLHVATGVLVLFLCDSLRLIFHHGQNEDVQTNVMATADKDALTNMRMYKAERNFFIVAFNIFFGVLLRRLISLVCLEAELQARADGKVLIVEKEKPGRFNAPLDKLSKDE